MKNFLKYLRMFFLINFKYKLKSIGKGTYIGKNVCISKNHVSLGKNVFIGSNSRLTVHDTYIDDYCMLAANVAIVGGDHKFDKVNTPIIFSGREEVNNVIIEKDVWIGHGAIILPGLIIGEGSIIGAGSVVTKDIQPYSIYVGNPAKFVKYRFPTKDDCYKHSIKINGKFKVVK
jgi:chloramphenicol O-acetyltransferase type B